MTSTVASVYFSNSINVEFLGLPSSAVEAAILLRHGTNCITSTTHFENTTFASEWYAPMTRCHVPEEQPPQTQSSF